jgi:hypothetical protein
MVFRVHGSSRHAPAPARIPYHISYRKFFPVSAPPGRRAPASYIVVRKALLKESGGRAGCEFSITCGMGVQMANGPLAITPS